MDDIALAYQKSLDYLYSFVDYSLTRNFRYTPDKFDLGRMEKLVGLLGNPHHAYQVIHVAGTKGKGSVSACTASSLRVAGYKVGFYTSPHLHEYTERIQVNGCPISKSDFVDLVDMVKPFAQIVEHISTFELTTAIAFLYFAQQQVDIAVVEVGLGGRLDATNVVNPLVAAISSLSLDHINVLGDTLAQIAYEKGGIIKPGRPVVISPQKEEARLVIERLCTERGSSLIQVGKDFLYALREHSLENQSFIMWRTEEQVKLNHFIEMDDHADWRPLSFIIPLLGYHQIENAATAYAILDTAREEGLQVTDEQIRAGFEVVKWPGRFEVLQTNPTVIIDSAHNRDSAARLRVAIDDYLPGQPVILVFGASEDKDIFGMLAELLPRVLRVIATQSSHPRAADPNKLVELAHAFGTPAQAIPDIKDAMLRAKELARSESAVVVAGSLFIAAAAREIWSKVIPVDC